MGKRKKTGAAVGSVSQEKVIASDIQNAEQLTTDENVVEKKISNEDDTIVESDVAGEMEEDDEHTDYDPSLDRLTKESKDYIIGFAKVCLEHPDCQADALRRYYAATEIERLAKENQKKLSQVDIIVDAAELLFIGRDLLTNYNSTHDHAIERLADIMSRHVPQLQKELNQRHAKLKKRK